MESHQSGLTTWQKVVGIIGLAVVIVLVILLSTGDHGPGRHTPDDRRQQPAPSEPLMTTPEGEQQSSGRSE